MKTNSIYEALNNVDDRFVAEAAKVRGNRPVAFMITAASLAAAIALAVGIRNWGGIIGNYIAPADAPVNQSGVSYEAPGFGESEASSPNDSVNRGKGKYVVNTNAGTFYFDVYPHDIVIPDSFKPGETEKGHYFYDLDMLPTEVFAEFGISPLMNDNFTDIIEFEPVLYKSGTTGEEWYYNGGPNVNVIPFEIDLEYYLYDKNINKTVYFHVGYYTDFDGGSFHAPDDANDEAINLKDGSVALISRNNTAFPLNSDGLIRNSATFAYNGVIYSVTVCDGNDYVEEDDIMDVLADLGVL